MSHNFRHVSKIMSSPRILNPLPSPQLKIPSISRYHYSPSGGGYHQHYSSGHGGSSHKGKKKSIALSALTLLAFLFFLNILQNCIQDQMDNMNVTSTTMAPTVLILSNRQEQRREQISARSTDKDKRKNSDQGYENIHEPVQLMNPLEFSGKPDNLKHKGRL